MSLCRHRNASLVLSRRSVFKVQTVPAVCLRGRVVVVNADPVRPIEDQTYVHATYASRSRRIIFLTKSAVASTQRGYLGTNITRTGQQRTGLRRNRPSSSICRARTWCLTKCYWSVVPGAHNLCNSTGPFRLPFFRRFDPSENNGRTGTVTFWRDNNMYVSQTYSTSSRVGEARHPKEFEIFFYNFY